MSRYIGLRGSRLVLEAILAREPEPVAGRRHLRAFRGGRP